MNNKILPAVLACLLMIWGLTGCDTTVRDGQTDTSSKEEGKLATAPNVPPRITRLGSRTVVLNFEAKEYVGDIADGVKYHFWSFNGTVPGPMARIRVGDMVEFHLTNPKSNTQPHNIDIHAVNGPGGGAAVNTVSPGESKVFTFKAQVPGLFIYHCAA